MNVLLSAAAVLLALCGSSAQAEITGYEALSDWGWMPRARTGITAGLASSYDRQGGNDDFNYYQWPEGFQTGDVDTVVKTLDGPGAITRFQMPHAAADEAFTVKITVDGVLRIDTNSDVLLGGLYDTDHMTAPLVQTLVGGQVSYEPICFQESLKIESCNYSTGVWARKHHYYQYNYQLFEPGRTVASYTGALTPAQTAARAKAVEIIANVGANPAGQDPSATVIATPSRQIPAGGSLSLADLSASGRIRRLSLRMDGASDGALDSLRLRVRYDGGGDCAIDVPVSHFFGAGHERVAYASVPLGTAGEEGFYCYWPMPFRRSVSVELYNAGSGEVSIDSAAVEYTTGGVSDRDAYLHAAFAEETLTPDDPYHWLLQTGGSGHYVGSLLYLQRDGIARGILEGDDIITVDGSYVLYGSGLEDAYNGGYYYNHVLYQDDDGDVVRPESGIGPYNGLLHMDDRDFDDEFFRTDQYRWLVSDAVAFTDGIDVRIEHFASANDALFGSTAFYYLLPDPPAPGDANFDGSVDIADLGALATYYGCTGAMWSEGDFNGDEVVDVADLGALATNYGSGAAVAGASVPEPAAAVVLALGGAALRRRKRGRAVVGGPISARRS